jgi:hypothetical protein
LIAYVASGIEVTDGIIRDRREMNDGIEALEVMRANIPDVSGSLFIAVGLHAEVASVVPTDIKADDLVASCPGERDQYCTDIATVTGDEHPHNSLLIVVDPAKVGDRSA